MIDVNDTPDWVSPPGETIIDILEERGWTQAELAHRTGFTTKHINLLIKGTASITEETALKLERVLGSTAGFWLTREAQYRESLARQAELEDLKPFVPWLKEIPVLDMARFGWIPEFSNKVRKVAVCLQFFGVANVEAWRTRYGTIGVAYRASDKLAKKQGAVAAWLRFGEIQAEQQSLPPFNKPNLLSLLPQLRALTLQSDPEVFLPQLKSLCAAVGITVVVAPAPKGCPVSGATRWVQPDRALVMLSLRYRSNDQFWFSFFHELGHLVLHGKKLVFLEGLEKGLNAPEETEADRWSGEVLIPSESAKRLAGIPKTAASIKSLADEIGIAPGIVLGRLQHDGLVTWVTELNTALKVFYRWVDDGEDQ